MGHNEPRPTMLGLAAFPVLVRHRLGKYWVPTLGGLVALVALIPTVVGFWLKRGFEVQDDAWYYWCIARNIAASGVSTFDRQTLTNGYHPLWMLVLVVQQLALGSSMNLTIALEALLVVSATVLFLRSVPQVRIGTALLFTCAMLYEMRDTVLIGMESSLLLVCLAFFAGVAARQPTTSPNGGIRLGLAAALCAGARIDAVLFVFPILCLLPCSRRVRLVALATLALIGTAYGLFNWAVFHAALPVSGSVKALGGLQLNHPLIAQMKQLWTSIGIRSRFHHTLVFLLLSPALVLLAKPGTVPRAFSLGTFIGGALYMANLLFASSWQIWPWYNYVVVFPLTSALLYAGLDGSRRIYPKIEQSVARSAWLLGCPIFLASLCAKPVAKVAGIVQPRGSFATLNHIALSRFGATLGGARIAMGDRAGSFAHEYAGPVTQLEGIVNDVTYLHFMRRGGDVTPLLCARGVRYLVDYETDLGNYDEHVVHVLRSMLTQTRSPTIAVKRSDEVGHVLEPSIYKKSAMEPDNTLYIWRLSECG